MKCTRILGMLFAGVLVAATQASATPSLTFSLDGGAIVASCSDQALCDLNPIQGIVNFSAIVGDFVVNVATGQTKPFGAFPDPNMDLNSVNTQFNSNAAHQLQIIFDEGGFNSTTPAFSESFGGTMDGAVLSASATAYINGVISGTPICTIGPVVGPAFAGNCTGAGLGVPGYQLTQVITLNTSAGTGDFSGDFRLRPVPEPASMLLVGGGSLLLGLRRRRKSA